MPVSKRFLFLVPILIMLLLALIPGAAAAKVGHMQTTDCSNQCTRWLTWPGTTYGFFSTITVSNPNISSVSYWVRDVVMTPDADKGTQPQVQFGVIKVGSNATQVCGPGLHYFIAEAINNNDQNVKCANVPSGAINNSAHFQENDYTSNGGGNLIQITDSFGTHLSDFIPYTAGVHSSWGSINLVENVQDLITGHYVWGSEWTGNEWATGDGVFHLVTVDGSYSSTWPPQMLWHTPPSSSPGGVQYSCVYDSTVNTCTLGS